MPDHDQHFKKLIEACFADLMRIVAPRIAPRLHLDRPTFLDKEQFTDTREGEHRRLDLVAQVSSIRGDPELVIVHVEVEAQAREYLARPEPLAWALAALMRRGGRSAVEHRLACLAPIARAEIDDARKVLLASCVETYVQLEESEWDLYEALLDREENREVAAMERTLLTTLDRAAQRGFAEGMEKGIAEGEQRGKRELLLDLLARRFGPLPDATVQRVRALTSSEELSRLAERVLDARKLDDLGL